MKQILLTSAALVAMIFASCSKENGGEAPNPGSTGMAYLSIRVDARSQTRASSENDGLPAESTLKKLYLITFTEAGNVVAVPGSTLYYNEIDATDPGVGYTDKKPKAVKISDASKNLVVIANPGDELLKAITGLTSSSTFGTFNAAIAKTTTADIVSTKGFAMITSRSDAGMNTGAKILEPYVAINGKIKIVTGTGTGTEQSARAAAEADRLDVSLERLAAKLVVTANPTKITAPDNAAVALTEWTVDAVNTTYYPFAEKTLIDVAHTSNLNGYAKNFYTKDPNFYKDPVLGYAKGLEYTKIDPDTYAPVLPFTYTWKTPGDASDPARIAYVIENTMAATDQVYGSATRIIMKATYYPEFDVAAGYVAGNDWFSWAGTYYPSLKALQDVYADAESATSALKAACESFLTKVKGIAAAGVPANATFDELTQTQLDKIANGGQVVKDGNNPVIRWYQKGQCYYSYEVRHDNETEVSMAFAKYGVVRNNWYDLTLNSVKGPGTPWYPQSTDPGDGDPDPRDDIDKQAGYLGVSVKINPWIIWTTGMNDID
ncbi:MAG: Mfa1 family fimbria major subunit [Rikenellaceae bacterium]|jgi:hypothetical protein|nr:Mfa1 family fimbria major subunit [Rikenellaceae bacterium]